MVGIYFSGTGNSRYCVEKFLEEYEPQAEAFSIENENAALEIGHQDEIVLGYPVQFSSIPKILKDYVISNHEIWKGKRVFIIATMGLFSGDGRNYGQAAEEIRRRYYRRSACEDA